MRRVSAALVSVALLVAVIVPATAFAAYPSKTGMLKEQIASQATIGALIGTPDSHNLRVSAIWFGDVDKSSTEAHIDVKVRMHGGSLIKGVLEVRKYSGKWYFYSITRGSEEGDVSDVAVPDGITTKSILSALTAQSKHQYMLTGIINGGYKRLTVLSRTNNVSTRQVNIKLNGGSRDSVLARVVAYRKTADSGKKYWFISAIK